MSGWYVEYDDGHQLNRCDPPPGEIRATVGRVTLEPGVYRVLFRDSDDGDRVLGGSEADLTGPDGTCAVACAHDEDEESDVFQRNVRACLVVEDEETRRAPVPLCLRGA